MNYARFAAHSSRSAFLRVLAIVATGLTIACGSQGTTSKTPPSFSGNTQVTLVLASTANDELSAFDLVLQTIVLTNQSGTTVSLIGGNWPGEFIHLNGGIEPLVTVTVPQGIYTSATATVGGADFTCVTIAPAGSAGAGDLDTNTWAYGYTPNSNVTVNLPSPVTITGASMVLSLDLLVSQSANFPSTCYTAAGQPFSITPTFSLAPLTVSAQPTNAANGKITQLEGEIASTDATTGSFKVSIPEAPGGTGNTRILSAASDSSTVFQGISGFSSLAAGMFVDMDGVLQSDGPLMASRIAVEDPSAVNVMSGPLLGVITLSGQPLLSAFGRLQQGPLLGGIGLGYGAYFDFSSAVFQASQQLTNLQSLPFVAAFNSSNMVAGQNIYMSFTTLPNVCCTAGTAQTVTLMPQTIDGTVVTSSQTGSFTDYTVSLASYSLFPALAALQTPWQASPATNPNIVEVYLDKSTQLLNTQTLAAGNTFRFYGLVFNDDGTLRMDCAQVNDGVAFTLPANAADQMKIGRVETTRREGLGGLQQSVTTVTRPHWHQVVNRQGTPSFGSPFSFVLLTLLL